MSTVRIETKREDLSLARMSVETINPSHFALMDQHVFHLRLQYLDDIEIHLNDEKEALHTQHNLKKALKLPSSSKPLFEHRDCDHTLHDKKCYVITLHKEHAEAIWGKENFDVIKKIDDMHHFKKYLILEDYLAQFDFTNPLFQQLFYLYNAKGLPFIFSIFADSPKLCSKLMNELPQSALNQIFSANKELNILHTVLQKQPSDICMKLIDQLSDENLNQIITTKNKNDWTALHIALHDESPEVCLKLIKRLSDKALQEAIFIKNDKKINALQIALANQPPEVCIQLINRISPAALSDALVQTETNELNILIHSIGIQPESIFIALIKKTDATSLARAACPISPRASSSSLDYAALYQTEKAYQVFLQKLNCPEAKEIINQYFRIEPANLMECFENIAFNKSFEKFELFFSLLEKENQQELFTRCKQDINKIHMRLILRALQTKSSYQQSDVIPLPRKIEKPQGRLDADSKFTLPLQHPKIKVDATLQKTLYADLFALLKPFNKTKFSKESKLTSVKQVEKAALEKFLSGAWVKIVRNDDSDDENKHNREFITHLLNPVKRQILRDLLGIEKQGFKLQLNPNEDKSSDRKTETVYSTPDGFRIIKADTVEQRKQWKLKKKPTQDSTKHPVTCVLPDVATGLFGYHTGRTMVGYAFNINPEKAKLLSIRDAGTSTRWWYSDDPHRLFGMAHAASQFICRSFADFINKIKKQPYLHNEALVKLNKQDLFAIIIAEDTPDARRIAIQRRLELIRLHKIDLPIIFYHIERQQAQRTVIYSSTEQYRDHPNLFLSELSQAIKAQKPKSKLKSLFFKDVEAIQVHFDYQDYRINHATANKILTTIKTDQKNPEECIKEILKLLQVKTVAKGIGETKEIKCQQQKTLQYSLNV